HVEDEASEPDDDGGEEDRHPEISQELHGWPLRAKDAARPRDAALYWGNVGLFVLADAGWLLWCRGLGDRHQHQDGGGRHGGEPSDRELGAGVRRALGAVEVEARVH